MKFIDLLNEGINDKYLFKAVFLAGGPGSGKSFIGNTMFKGLDAKFLNSDDIFEAKLKRNNIPLKIDDKNVEQFKKQMEVRGRAKELTKSKQNLLVNGMLPLVIDGTGKDFKKIKKQKDALEAIGYETGLVFVNTSLNVAKQRNLERSRTVPEEVVVKSWNDVQKNLGKFQSAFNGNFTIVDNNNILTKDQIQKLGIKLHRKALKFMDSPLKNPKGISTISMLKKLGGKLLSDLPDGTFK